MKRLIATIVVFIILGGQSAVGQESETLFDGNIYHSGFGAPVVKFSQVAGELGVWVGGRGAWLLNFSGGHSLAIGGGGTGLSTQPAVPDPDYGNPAHDYVGSVGYGGVDLEYINRSHKLVHFTVSTRIGGGGLSVYRRGQEDDYDANSDDFFIIEPGANIEFNFTTFMRLTCGISYMHTNGITHAGFEDSDFSGLTGNIAVKFGGF